MLDKAQLRAEEPAIKGEAAIFSPRTGIVDFRVVCEAMASQFVDDGGELRSGTEVTGIRARSSHNGQLP